MKIFYGSVVAAALLVVSSVINASGVAESSTEKLPHLNLDISQTSVSGLSSGAFMTSQFYIANSDIMVGAGIIAGGPYLCAQSWDLQSYLTNASTACMNPLTKSTGPNTPKLVELTKELSAEGRIDAVENLKDDKIYIFSGQADEVVTTMVVEQTKALYVALGVPEASINFQHSVDAGHAIITADDSDSACNLTKAPFINDCDFIQSQAILETIYADLNPPAEQLSGKLIAFDQKAFIASDQTSMSDTAYVYVPNACLTEQCRLHIVFHGCLQGAEVVGDAYYNTTGYNEMADTNRMVVLYPQVQPSNSKPFNPQGCWDFWGYSLPGESQPDYFSRKAPQISAVRAMVDALAAER